MNFAEIIRMFFGLAVTLGLMGLVVAALRRFGPETIRRFQGQNAEKRLQVLETLVLDPARRLVLVRIDSSEQLILLGEGRLVAAPDRNSPTVSLPKEPAS